MTLLLGHEGKEDIHIFWRHIRNTLNLSHNIETKVTRLHLMKVVHVQDFLNLLWWHYFCVGRNELLHIMTFHLLELIVVDFLVKLILASLVVDLLPDCLTILSIENITAHITQVSCALEFHVTLLSWILVTFAIILTRYRIVADFQGVITRSSITQHFILLVFELHYL